MSNQYIVYEDTLVGIANAIRHKLDTTEEIPLLEFAEQIENIKGGGSDTIYTRDFSKFNLDFSQTNKYVIDDANVLKFGTTSRNNPTIVNPFVPQSNSWEILLAFSVTSYNTNWPILIGPLNTTSVGALIHLTKATKGITLALSTNGNTPTTITVQSDNPTQILEGIKYWVKAKYDSATHTYSLWLSNDGKTWNFEASLEDDGICYGNATAGSTCSYLCLGCGYNIPNNHLFNGNIYLEDSYIKIGDELFWGVEDKFSKVCDNTKTFEALKDLLYLIDNTNGSIIYNGSNAGDRGFIRSSSLPIIESLAIRHSNTEGDIYCAIMIGTTEDALSGTIAGQYCDMTDIESGVTSCGNAYYYRYSKYGWTEGLFKYIYDRVGGNNIVLGATYKTTGSYLTKVKNLVEFSDSGIPLDVSLLDMIVDVELYGVIPYSQSVIIND